jgi:prevent-host-death family protein
MNPAPFVVTITQLRQNAARLIEDAAKAEADVYVTQCGYATAVLLSRKRYDMLLNEVAQARRESLRLRRAWDRADRAPLNDAETTAFLRAHGVDPDTYVFDE